MAASRILIVDDEKVIADSLTVIFEKQGYEARAAYSAEQALEIIAQWRPHLAILDIVLPGMNGIDLAMLIQSSYPAISTMLMSGQPATSALVEKAALLGHQFNVRAKPIPIPDMLAAVSHLLGSDRQNGAPTS